MSQIVVETLLVMMRAQFRILVATVPHCEDQLIVLSAQMGKCEKWLKACAVVAERKSVITFPVYPIWWGFKAASPSCSYEGSIPACSALEARAEIQRIYPPIIPETIELFDIPDWRPISQGTEDGL